jgi:hypothetical protein
MEKGSKPPLEQAKWKYTILGEGVSDTHTLWFNGFPAMGLPSATTWKEEIFAPLFDGINPIYVVNEGDKGGEAVLKWISSSRIRDRVKLLSFDGF